MKTMTLHLAAAFMAAGTLLGADAKNTVPTAPVRSTSSRTQTVQTVQAKPASNVTPVRWLAVSDRPCDSAACRAVRFPWSSVPGS
jgi:hypothetical protein